MTIFSLPAPCYFYAGDTIPPFMVELYQYPGGTPSPFADCDPSCHLAEKSIVRTRATNEVWFVHYRFKHCAKQSGISKTHLFSPVIWRGGAGMASIKKRDVRISANAIVLKPPVRHPEGEMRYRVDVFDGDAQTTNGKLIEKYFFPDLPPEVANLEHEQAKAEWLANYVKDAVNCKQRLIEATTRALEQEHQKQFPSRNPAKDYNRSDFDHYKNQQEVVLKLLCKKWPRLSRAFDGISAAKTPQEKSKEEAGLWLAYIADYKALFKELPVIDQNEFAELRLNSEWHDRYITLMSEAIKAVPQTDKRDWQLAIGWIEKHYYRMNEAELEKAFVTDWGYSPVLRNGKKVVPYKGHALAARAHRIGLVSYLIPGPKRRLRTS